MKNDALLRGAEVVPSSSMGGTDVGNGFGSEYGLSLKTAPLPWYAIGDVDATSNTKRFAQSKVAEKYHTPFDSSSRMAFALGRTCST